MDLQKNNEKQVNHRPKKHNDHLQVLEKDQARWTSVEFGDTSNM